VLHKAPQLLTLANSADRFVVFDEALVDVKELQSGTARAGKKAMPRLAKKEP
jgi:hypothetical protein